ncbi:hypothetical protein PIB30_006144 [Stylosanthes scabra]|uniref:Uncharacterized protein n=1 Tax=Stylosanthes scabra TaxID=79078 RepID=A0ABU6X3Q0_9FABA|nr:hypothetical protein [Stylosanthes scabra]
MAQPTLEQIAAGDRDIIYRLDDIAHVSRDVNRLVSGHGAEVTPYVPQPTGRALSGEGGVPPICTAFWCFFQGR